jgi:hypothetical protein
MPRTSTKGAVGLAALLACACASPKPEAAALVAAVDRFHRASNDDRPARADALERLPCADKAVCDARKECVAATGATAQALRLKHEAESFLAEVQASGRPPDEQALRALPGKLDEATRLLGVGRAAMPGCDRRILVLRERYGL